jgi:hypothetical protein
MSATVAILVWHGASGSKASTGLTDGQAIRFKQADNDTVDLINKIPIPGSGTNYSYCKNFQFSCTVTPSNVLDNLKVYSDGTDSMGTGVDLLVKDSATYVDPTTTTTSAVSGTSSIFGYSSGAPLAITGSLSNPSTGAFGDYIVMQMSVASTASPGTTTSETLTFSFDES